MLIMNDQGKLLIIESQVPLIVPQTGLLCTLNVPKNLKLRNFNKQAKQYSVTKIFRKLKHPDKLHLDIQSPLQFISSLSVREGPLLQIVKRNQKHIKEASLKNFKFHCSFTLKLSTCSDSMKEQVHLWAPVKSEIKHNLLFYFYIFFIYLFEQ